jgi:hypothetical protein
VVLYVGAENWPFPIPLVSRNGVWIYDSDAGAKEVLYRRIGENEVTAMAVCHSLIAPVTKPQARSDADIPVSALLATARTSNKPVTFQGYYFRILPNSGNDASAFVAYPTTYGASGVMSFIVDDTGVIYEKDLGPSTVKVATAMPKYRSDPSWTPAETEPGP